uniref:Uncharacterized protein n=1 Tax=Knipowitschia caucasica TaxID=637954 RepID=A0AAV2LFS8_KNICA
MSRPLVSGQEGGVNPLFLTDTPPPAPGNRASVDKFLVKACRGDELRDLLLLPQVCGTDRRAGLELMELI